MRRWLKVLLAVLAALVVLLILNAIVIDHQTKGAKVTINGARILHLSGGDLQMLDANNPPHLTANPKAPEPEPIVLLHCYTCSIDWWLKLAPILSQGGHRVIAIDLLGHGGSEMPSNGYSMQDQAQLVAQALDRLQVKGPVTVVGHSLGGAVATALAEQSPKLVGRLVIIDSEPDNSYGHLDFVARLPYVPVIGEATWRLKTSSLVREGLKEAFAPGYDVPDQFVDDVKRMTYTAYDDSHSAFDSYVGESPLDKRISSLGMPLLAIFGAEDQIIDPRKALSAYAGISGAQTALVQGAGHSPNVEKPAETAALIERFDRSTAASAAAGPAPSTANSKRPQGGKITVTCDDITFIGSGRPNWRTYSAVAGPFGLSGAGRDFATAQPVGGVLETKMPAIVEGTGPVIVRVPEAERGQVGLIYGRFHRVHTVGEAAQQVIFKPCADKPRTVWPGVLALASRHRITLEVVVGGKVRRLNVG
jgi:pimeloyl-ACP methyl ester carboxylesterase